MITLMQVIRQLLCLSILYLSIPRSLTAQDGIPLNWEWKKIPAKQDTPVNAKAGDNIKITIAKLTDSGGIADFFHKSIVIVVKKGINENLYKRIANAADTIKADSVVKSYITKKGITSFNLSSFLGTFRQKDTIIIKPFLGPGIDIKDEKSIKRVVIDTAGQKAQINAGSPKPGEANTVPSFKPVGSSLFIPPATMEADWAGKFTTCESQTAPRMNKHTRWAITYDYNTGDPVAVWRRSDKISGDGGCCDVVPEKNRKKEDKNKNKKEDTSIAVKIALQAAALEKEWLALEKVVKDTVLRQRAVGVRTSIAGLYKSIQSSMSDSAHKTALAKLQEIKEQIAIIRAMNGAMPVLRSYVSQDKGCCSQVYCGIPAKRMSPTVKRDVLISVVNFHPYRDSFSLVVSYDDHFGQDLALFNSTFASIPGQAGSPKKDSTGTKTLKGGAIEEANRNAGKRYVELFDTLRQELKWYYTSKVQQVYLNPGVVENGVNYIKQRMSDVLGITDFTEPGIAKRAEEVADLVKLTDTSLESFFGIVREAAAWWGKVANYRIFDNKSVLVRNKDVMNIVLKKYSYGKLASSDEEATRPYYTSGGFKIDFSVGLFGNFITDKLYTTKTVSIGNDTTFFKHSNGLIDKDSIVSITAASRDSIIRDDRGKFNIGPAVFTHFYWRTGFDLNVGGTIGLAINQEALPRYLFGGSLLIGRDQRLVITTGLACGPAKELASGLKEGDKIQLSSFANSTLPTRDVWQNKWFVAVSWNFAGINVGK